MEKIVRIIDGKRHIYIKKTDEEKIAEAKARIEQLKRQQELNELHRRIELLEKELRGSSIEKTMSYFE